MLGVAGVLEGVWARGLKYRNGFTRLAPSVRVVVAAAASFWLLAVAVRILPAGTAYAVWVGIGAADTARFGMRLLEEPATVARLACIGLIVAGVPGLRFLGGA